MKISDILLQEDFIFSLCTFLDTFRYAANKYGLICDEPESGKINRLKLCILTAVAHKLSNDYNLDTPEWVKNDFYKMPYPVYSFDTQNKEYQNFLLETSPIEFALRNIYYGANAIERV